MILSPNYRALLASFKTIPNVAIIKTSFLAFQKDWTLPAAILDMENPIYDTVLEDGTLAEVGTRMSVSAFVPVDTNDPEMMMDRLDKLTTDLVAKISATFPGKSLRIDLPTIDYMQFGKAQQAFGVVFFVTVSDGD